MAGSDPYDELGVSPSASDDEIERAYRRRVVERHRKGVWRIADQLQRIQRALFALRDPREREHYERARQRLARERAEDHFTRQRRQLTMLESYKQRMHRDALELGAANHASHAAGLAEIERSIAREEQLAAARARRQRLWAHVRAALMLALVISALIGVLWLRA